MATAIRTTQPAQDMFDLYAFRYGRDAATAVWEAAADIAQNAGRTLITTDDWKRAVQRVNPPTPAPQSRIVGYVISAEAIMAAASEVVTFESDGLGGFRIKSIEPGPAAK